MRVDCRSRIVRLKRFFAAFLAAEVLYSSLLLPHALANLAGAGVGALVLFSFVGRGAHVGIHYGAHFSSGALSLAYGVPLVVAASVLVDGVQKFSSLKPVEDNPQITSAVEMKTDAEHVRVEIEKRDTQGKLTPLSRSKWVRNPAPGGKIWPNDYVTNKDKMLDVCRQFQLSNGATGAGWSCGYVDGGLLNGDPYPYVVSLFNGVEQGVRIPSANLTMSRFPVRAAVKPDGIKTFIRNQVGLQEQVDNPHLSRIGFVADWWDADNIDDMTKEDPQCRGCGYGATDAFDGFKMEGADDNGVYMRTQLQDQGVQDAVLFSQDAAFKEVTGDTNSWRREISLSPVRRAVDYRVGTTDSFSVLDPATRSNAGVSGGLYGLQDYVSFLADAVSVLAGTMASAQPAPGTGTATLPQVAVQALSSAATSAQVMTQTMTQTQTSTQTLKQASQSLAPETTAVRDWLNPPSGVVPPTLPPGNNTPSSSFADENTLKNSFDPQSGIFKPAFDSLELKISPEYRCPTPDFSFHGYKFVLSTHCELWGTHAEQLRVASIILWTLFCVRIVFRA